MEKIAKIIPAISLEEKNKIEYLQNKIEELSLNNITLLKGDFKDTVRKHFF